MDFEIIRLSSLHPEAVHKIGPGSLSEEFSPVWSDQEYSGVPKHPNPCSYPGSLREEPH